MAGKPERKNTIESAHVSGDEKCLVLTLLHQDPEVVAFAKSGGLGDNPVEAAKRIFTIGVLSVATGSAQATISELYRVVAQLDAMSAMPQLVAEQLGKTVGRELSRVIGDDERPGALTAAMDAVIAQAADSLSQAIQPIREALLGPGPKALPQVLEGRLQNALNRGTRDALNRLFDVEAGSPLMTHLANGEKAIAALRSDMVALETRLREQVSALADKVLIAHAQLPTAPIQAGRTWESDTLDDIARITSILGDTVESVGNSPGHGRSKAGDHVLQVYDEDFDGIRVAVECRTGSSRPVTVSQLRRLVDNREAHSGLLLAQMSAALPRDAKAIGFRVYLAERVVVLHYDRGGAGAEQLLATAVQVARLLARLSATSGGTLVEREQIRDGIARIENALSHLRPLRAAVTGIEKEMEVVRKHATELDAEIRRVLIDLATTLTAA
jgi:hypothetical protein